MNSIEENIIKKIKVLPDKNLQENKCEMYLTKEEFNYLFENQIKILHFETKVFDKNINETHIGTVLIPIMCYKVPDKERERVLKIFETNDTVCLKNIYYAGKTLNQAKQVFLKHKNETIDEFLETEKAIIEIESIFEDGEN